MPEIQKAKRLAKVANEFNIGRATIVEYLVKQGFNIEDKPTTKVTPEMYDALLKEFRQEKLLKGKAEQIQIGQTEKHDVTIDEKQILVHKPEDETETLMISGTAITPEEITREETAPEKEPEKKPEPVEKPVLQGPKVVGTIELETIEKKKKEKEKPAEKIPPEEEVKPATKEKPVTVGQKLKTPAPEEKEKEVIKTEYQKLKGPKITGKIELPTEEEKKKTKKPVASSSVEKETEKKRRTRKRIHKKESREGKKQKGKEAEVQEISQQEIEEKLRKTMAAISGGLRQKSARSRHRREKRLSRSEELAGQEQEGNVLEVTEFISVAELASLLDKSPTDIINSCLSLGIVVSINQRLDAEVIELVASEFGYEVKFISVTEQDDFEEEEEDNPEDLVPRPPIVTIMGHVDHGKTSLLDYIRKTNVIAGEKGGITQHIGAYEVSLDNGKKICFLDTPGHEAFTAMRARGAKVTDIAVIVIAADDNIMPQTKEAISHAQAAGVPMIFAINKIDKPDANPDRIKEQLANMNILVEDWGGKYQVQEISAKTGANVDALLEKILLEAEMLDLKANPNRRAIGTIIEATLDKGRGYVSTVLVQIGTMRQGDMVVSGSYYGHVKAMFNERGLRLQEAGPSTPVQLLGLNGAPQAGEKFKVYESEQEAKAAANRRAQLEREQGLRAQKHITLDEIGRRLSLGTFKELNIIIKGDVDGSVEALADSLLKLSTEEIQVNVQHKAVGPINESDVLLASASDAIIIGFQVRPGLKARKLAEQENIEIRTYSVIYDAIEEIKSALEGMLEPKVVEKVTGNVEVKEIFKITKVGKVAGCLVTDGKITRDSKVHVVRDGIVIYTGELSSLKRFKDDVKEVRSGQECGLTVKDFADLKVGDIIEAYVEEEIKRTLD